MFAADSPRMAAAVWCSCRPVIHVAEWAWSVGATVRDPATPTPTPLPRVPSLPTRAVQMVGWSLSLSSLDSSTPYPPPLPFMAVLPTPDKEKERSPLPFSLWPSASSQPFGQLLSKHCSTSLLPPLCHSPSRMPSLSDSHTLLQTLSLSLPLSPLSLRLLAFILLPTPCLAAQAECDCEWVFG